MNITTVENIDGKNIMLFGRDEKGNRIIKKVTDFKPYFYYENNDEWIKESIFGHKLNKKEYSNFKDRYNVDTYSKTFEFDVYYTTRYLIDRHPIPFTPPKLKTLYIDIETDMSLDFMNAPKQILSIVCYDNFSQRSKIFNSLDGTDEKVMLKNLISYVMKVDPDLFCAWNVTFDMGYIINRCKRLGVDYKLLSPLLKCKINQYGRETKVQIAGRVCFDLLPAYKNLQPSLLSSYKLDVIAEKELGEKKVKVDLKTIKNDLNKLIKYNKKDVELIYKLDKKLGIIEYYNELRCLVGCDWDDVFWNSKMIDILFIRECTKKGIILPTKVKREYKKYKGAYVVAPTPGIHDNVICLDLKSLYPSVMCQFNISPETLNKKGEIKLSNGINFEKREGMTRNIIKTLFKERTHYKTLMRHYQPNTPEFKVFYNKQLGVKFLVNSFYGYFGFVFGRMYNIDIAESITSTSQDIIKFVIEKVKELGYEVVAGDTDSVYFKSGTDDIKESIEIGKDCTAKINEMFTEFVQSRGCDSNEFIELNFETLNKRMFFGTAKKRYAYWNVWDEGVEVDIIKYKGFEIRKSDSPELVKKAQKDIFHMLLKENKSKEDVDKYLLKIVENIKNDIYDIKDLVIPKSITKDIESYGKLNKYGYKIGVPYHVKGMQWMHDNRKAKLGYKVRVLYVIHNQTDAVAVDEDDMDLLNEFKIDYDKMTNTLLLNTIKTVYEILEWGDWKELLPKILVNSSLERKMGKMVYKTKKLKGQLILSNWGDY